MGDQLNAVRDAVTESLSTTQRLLADEDLLRRTAEAVDVMVEALRAGNKVLFCGNGGSAADAQHLSAELSATPSTAPRCTPRRCTSTART